MTESATLESPQTHAEPQEPTGTNGQAQEATAEQPNPRCPTHGTVLNAAGNCLLCQHPELAAASTADPAMSMNWQEQKTAEQLEREAAEADGSEAEAIGSKGAVEGDPPDSEHWRLILAARDEEKDAEDECNEAAEAHKNAKKRLEAASDRLGKLIDESRYPSLFNGQRVKPESVENAKAPETTGTPGEGLNVGQIMPNPIQDDAWRSVPLADLGIKPTTLKILAEHTPALTTLGEFSDWQAKKGDHWATDIKGVGPSKRQEIEDASFAYFQKHPQPAKAADADKPLTLEEMPVINVAGDKTPEQFIRDQRDGSQVAVQSETLKVTKFTDDQVRAAYYPNLLKESGKSDKPYDCPDVLVLDARPCIAVPGPVGGADYFLLMLGESRSEPTCSPYSGVVVTHKGRKFWVEGDPISLVMGPLAQGASDAKQTRGAARRRPRR